MLSAICPSTRSAFCLPLSIIDNAAYEFYRLAPPGVMQVMIPIGLAEFSPATSSAHCSSRSRHLDKLMERGVGLVVQSGTPLPTLIGVAAHDRMIDFMASHTGVKASSTVLAVCRAARHLGIRKMALVNKWSDAMNKVLGEFWRVRALRCAGPSPTSCRRRSFRRSARATIC